MRQAFAFPGLRMEYARGAGKSAMAAQHFHSFYELYYLWEGERQYFIRNEVYRINRGALVFISPGNIHQTVSCGDAVWERTLLEISATRYQELMSHFHTLDISEMPAILVCPLEGEQREHMEWLLRQMTRNAETQNRGYLEYILHRLQEILLFLLLAKPATQANALQSDAHRKVTNIAIYIESTFDQIDSLEHICRRFYISKSHLCHIFREATGMTVQEYIASIRIKNAQRLLVETTLSITAIAHSVGYNSLTNFERIFKRLSGIAPREYRSSNR